MLKITEKDIKKQGFEHVKGRTKKALKKYASSIHPVYTQAEPEAGEMVRMIVFTTSRTAKPWVCPWVGGLLV